MTPNQIRTGLQTELRQLRRAYRQARKQAATDAREARAALRDELREHAARERARLQAEIVSTREQARAELRADLAAARQRAKETIAGLRRKSRKAAPKPERGRAPKVPDSAQVYRVGRLELAPGAPAPSRLESRDFSPSFLGGRGTVSNPSWVDTLSKARKRARHHKLAATFAIYVPTGGDRSVFELVEAWRNGRPFVLPTPQESEEYDALLKASGKRPQQAKVEVNPGLPQWWVDFGPDKALTPEPYFGGNPQLKSKRYNTRALALAAARKAKGRETARVRQAEHAHAIYRNGEIKWHHQRGADDLQGFAARVVSLAHDASMPKFHDDRAFLGPIANAMGYTRDRFNRMVLQAHQKGLLRLTRADLVGAMDPELVQWSETPGPGKSTFHFVAL